MYLFQPLWLRIYLVSYQIYIPLCIYFNVDKDFFMIFDNNLHSTMYLFQLQVPSKLKPHRIKFTFHYVSISTDFISDIVTCRHKFTFHYVSISTRTAINTIQGSFNLHSTMYLFQLHWNWYRCQSKKYLHSTMYLFQQKT